MNTKKAYTQNKDLMPCKKCSGNGYNNAQRDKRGMPKFCKTCKGRGFVLTPKAELRAKHDARMLRDARNNFQSTVDTILLNGDKFN